MFILEYIWLDSNYSPRSKTKVITSEIKFNSFQELTSKLPIWNFDGSSTGQAITSDSEVLLKPVKTIPDPFRNGANNENRLSFLVLCECLNVDMSPNKYNTRHYANELFTNNSELEPMFGIEQEFFISSYSLPENPNTSTSMVLQPICFSNKRIQIKEQEDYYCGVGFNNVLGRHLIEEAFNNLLFAGINITGLNAEVAPSQWEFQVCSTGIDAADSLILTRYICNRTFEKHNCSLDLTVKPREDLNGSGCHVNFSTLGMRNENGYGKIKEAIENLSKHHSLHIKHYGTGNELRLTGHHETSSINDFSYGVGSRNTSIRIPNETHKNNCGYLEDRRPSSTMDPYVTTSLLFATSCGITNIYN